MILKSPAAVSALAALLTLGVVAGTAYTVLLGCGGGARPAVVDAKPRALNWTVIPSGVVESKGVTISAQDGSFRLIGPTGADPPPMFRTPFSMMCNRLGRLSPATWRTAANLGAHGVEIVVPGRERPLYGVLALCRAHPNDGSAAARSFRIVVPQSRIAQTAGGRVSYIYEMGSTNFPTWLLWLSESPLPVGVGGAGGGAEATAAPAGTTGRSEMTGDGAAASAPAPGGACAALQRCCSDAMRDQVTGAALDRAMLQCRNMVAVAKGNPETCRTMQGSFTDTLSKLGKAPPASCGRPVAGP